MVAGGGANLDQMLQPIALYPDPLIAIILPAATLPSEVVQADRFVRGGGDPSLIDQQPWDSSVKALARYPDVLKMMDDNLEWTTALGQAFSYQQADVMDAIQRLRAQAQALGNLQSSPQWSVVNQGGRIAILPPSPQMIYVPVYQPQVVYYQRSYNRPLISFGAGLAIGSWLTHDLDWRNRNVVVWDHNRPRPAGWWTPQQPRVQINNYNVWQPTRRSALTTAGSWDRGRVPLQQHSPAVTTRPTPIYRPQSARGALVGVPSSQDTHAASRRGSEIHQAAPRPASPAHSAPAHSEGSDRRNDSRRH